MSRDLSFTWFDGDQALSQVEAEWKSIEQNPSISIFMCWNWLNCWWRQYGKNRSLYIMRLNINGHTELFIPFQAITKRTLGCISISHWHLLGSQSSAGSDYLGAVFKQGCQLSTEEIGKIYRAIEKKKPSYSPLHLDEFGQSAFPEKEALYNYLNKNYYLRNNESTYCPVTDLSGSWDDFLNKLSRNFRSQIRRTLKKFNNNSDLSVTQYRSENDMKDKVEELQRLNTQRISRLGKTSSFDDSRLGKFLTEATKNLASQQQCYFYQLFYGDISIAIILLLDDGEQISYLLGGFDQQYEQHSPINILFIHAIGDAIKNQRTKFNFLKGQENYKYRWQAIDDVNDNITILGGPMQLSLYYFEQFVFRINRKVRHLWQQYIAK